MLWQDPGDPETRVLETLKPDDTWQRPEVCLVIRTWRGSAPTAQGRGQEAASTCESERFPLPPNKNYLAPNYRNSEAEKPCADPALTQTLLCVWATVRQVSLGTRSSFPER